MEAIPTLDRHFDELESDFDCGTCRIDGRRKPAIWCVACASRRRPCRGYRNCEQAIALVKQPFEIEIVRNNGLFSVTSKAVASKIFVQCGMRFA